MLKMHFESQIISGSEFVVKSTEIKICQRKQNVNLQHLNKLEKKVLQTHLKHLIIGQKEKCATINSFSNCLSFINAVKKIFYRSNYYHLCYYNR